MNHTPGPWKTLITNGRKINSALIITSSTAARAIAIDCTKSGDSIKQDEANAELIAAAPDLLKTLEILIERFIVVCPDYDGQIGEQDAKLILLTRHAIAKTKPDPIFLRTSIRGRMR